MNVGAYTCISMLLHKGTFTRYEVRTDFAQCKVESLKQLTERAFFTLLFFLILPADKGQLPNLGQYNWEAAETDVLI